MTQRLNLAETIDQRIDTQPLHVIFASYNMWVGFERDHPKIPKENSLNSWMAFII